MNFINADVPKSVTLSCNWVRIFTIDLQRGKYQRISHRCSSVKQFVPTTCFLSNSEDYLEKTMVFEKCFVKKSWYIFSVYILFFCTYLFVLFKVQNSWNPLLQRLPVMVKKYPPYCFFPLGFVRANGDFSRINVCFSSDDYEGNF